MTGHVAPHRWADAIAGRLGRAEQDALDRHAEACPRCAGERERVLRASDSFPAIRAQAAPELAWDAVRAKVHWAVSRERRQPARRRGWRVAWAAAAVAAVGVVGGVVAAKLVPGGGDAATADAAETPGASTDRGARARVEPAPARVAARVARVTGDVMIDGVRISDSVAPLAAGAVIATGDARLDVELAGAGAFALGPRSTLELRRLDAGAIELAVEGTIDVEVVPRAAGARFAVIAGERTVEVRGTQFRVRHAAAATSVACRRGRVEVRDADGRVEVGTARRLDVAAGAPVAGARVVPLSVDELTELAAALRPPSPRRSRRRRPMPPVRCRPSRAPAAASPSAAASSSAASIARTSRAARARSPSPA